MIMRDNTGEDLGGRPRKHEIIVEEAYEIVHNKQRVEEIH